MKHAVAAVAAGVAIALSQSALAVDADAAKAKAKEWGCLNCHNLDAKKKVGPGWAEVASKNQGKAPADLAAAMKAKPVHTPVLKKTSEPDYSQLLEFILGLK